MTRPADQGPVASRRPGPCRSAAIGLVAVLVAALAFPSVTAARGAVASDAGSGAGRPRATVTGGSLRAWGLNNFGQLGNGATTSSDTPVKVQFPNGTKVKAISAGAAHSLAVTGNGRLYAWGFNGEVSLATAPPPTATSTSRSESTARGHQDDPDSGPRGPQPGPYLDREGAGLGPQLQRPARQRHHHHRQPHTGQGQAAARPG
jgi:Regulator of chromosome condensation (RCC1) repeat